MRLLSVSLCLLFPFFLFSQTQKGAAPITNHQLTPSGSPITGTTSAIVIGISNYQDDRIPDLRFAHRDAEAFAAWLASPAGGNVPADNVLLFTNEKATNAAVITALYALLDACQPGDQVVFYFSGHGDVETKIRNQPGYLLTYDTPPNVYAAGALNLRDLQEIVGTLAQQQVRMVLVTDACHAGKLAGSGVGGTQATAASLQQQFANEVKIMSCQPNEFSLEGEQWGGGRGVFSYHLVDALTGLADKNSDGTVSLLEVGRYLEEIVPAETAPHPQLPVVSGDRMAALAQVDAASLAALKQSRTGTAALLFDTGSKGLEDEVLAKADPLTRSHYEDFKKALATHNLLEENDSSAEAHFRYLIAREALAPLHGMMRRNYAVALLDEVQQALNALLESDPYETNKWRFNPDSYDQYPLFLRRAQELLGEKHHMFASLQAKKLYFEGYLFSRNIVNMSNAAERDSLRNLAKRMLMESASLEPSAAYVYHAIGSLYFALSPPQTDSMLFWSEKALEYAPAWLLPYLDISYEFSLSQSDFKRVEFWLKKALEIDSHSYAVSERLSWLYQWMSNTQASLDLCDTMIAMRPDLFNAYGTKGVTHLMRNEYPEAEKMFKRSMELESGFGNWSTNFQFQLLCRTRRWEKAKELIDDYFLTKQLDNYSSMLLISNLLQPMSFHSKIGELEMYCQKMIGLNVHATHNAAGKLGLGIIQLNDGDYQAAEQTFQEALQIDPTPSLPFITATTCLAIIAERKGMYDEADRIFQEAFEVSKQASGLDLAFCLAACRLKYGQFLIRQQRHDEARQQFRLAEAFQSKCWEAQYGYALLAAAAKRKEEALNYLEKALDYWLPEKEMVVEEPLFKKIRKTKRFKAMMAKHFPDYPKN